MGGAPVGRKYLMNPCFRMYIFFFVHRALAALVALAGGKKCLERIDNYRNNCYNYNYNKIQTSKKLKHFWSKNVNWWRLYRNGIRRCLTILVGLESYSSSLPDALTQLPIPRFMCAIPPFSKNKDISYFTYIVLVTTVAHVPTIC